MAAHRYWRLRADSLFGAGFYFSCAELKLRTVMDGPLVTGTGTAIVDSTLAGTSAANAFDGNLNTYWTCNASGAGAWIGYDFGAGNDKEIVQLALQVRGDSLNANLQSPQTGVIQYSDDGAAWTTAYTLPTQASWLPYEERVWTVGRDTGTQIDVTKVNGFAVIGNPGDRAKVTSARGFAVLGGAPDRATVSKVSAYAVIEDQSAAAPRRVVFVAT